MQIIRAKNCPETQWKNGGGSTTELVVYPPGSSFDSFGWRVSLARITTAGPFSNFRDIDRTLAVVAGNGLIMRIDDHPTFDLTSSSAPFSFNGEDSVAANPVAGDTFDLNVMTRRALFRHQLKAVSAPQTYTFGEDPREVAVVLSYFGGTSLTAIGFSQQLPEAAAAVLNSSDCNSFRIEPGLQQCHLVKICAR